MFGLVIQCLALMIKETQAMGKTYSVCVKESQQERGAEGKMKKASKNIRENKALTRNFLLSIAWYKLYRCRYAFEVSFFLCSEIWEPELC